MTNSTTYYVVKVAETGAQLFSSEYRRFNDQTHRFPSEEAALAWINARYAKHTKKRIYVEGDNGEAVPVGWVFCFRNSDLSHTPVETWNQQDWVELRKVTETSLSF